MLTNADCTIYEKNSYARHYIPDIYWNDSRGQTVTKNGVQIQDSLIVYIYDDSYLPRAGDIIVKGECDYVFDTTSEQTASASMKAFREAYPDFAVVKNVNDCWFGGLPHYEVTAR